MAKRPKKVLIVEDDRAIASMIKYILRFEGFDVCMAYSVDEAMELVGEEHPDLILSDIMFPNRDGLTFAREVRKICDVPIIFLTALIGPKNRSKGLAAGAVDYITKPFEPQDLVNRIKTALQG